jgi:hypothetical protein
MIIPFGALLRKDKRKNQIPPSAKVDARVVISSVSNSAQTHLRQYDQRYTLIILQRTKFQRGKF